MAAYAALTSLKHIIHDLQNHHSPPISISKKQARSLTEVITFLQEFLLGHNSSFAYSEEADPLETRIADAAYAAEDVIESEIVDRIRSQSTIAGKTTEDDLYQDLQLVIEEMDLIKKETMMIHTYNIAKPQLQRNVPINVGSSSSTSFTTGKNNIMVGCDDVFLELLENLMGSRRNRQIIPITGMGGIGKTTLARNIFENACVKENFHIRAWTTISQDYNARQALKELLIQAKGNSGGVSENELGLELYQYLSGRRYLIVMDDIWSIELYDKLNCYFPDCNDGSRIIVTTRLSNLTFHMNNGFKMKFLDEAISWNLFSKIVFGEENFPFELEEIGKKIVRKCRGLPLSIVTIGGILAKSEQTRENWEHIDENLNSIVNSEDDKYCLRILKMSYNHLPVYLKPCFLYMGVFEEDRIIRVSTLIKMWVSEGFLVPTSEKSLETVAEENLKHLIERNLVVVHSLGSTGNIKYCKIHDLLRDICLREAEKERFFSVVRKHTPLGINSTRRVIIHRNTSKEIVLEALESIPHARSFICDYYDREIETMPLNLRFLRTLKAYERDLHPTNRYFLEDVFQLVNLRYLGIRAVRTTLFPSSLNLLWNLYTLKIFYDRKTVVTAPIEIWNMPHLRHVKFSCGVLLPDPPTDDFVIMENLQTLKIRRNFKLNQEMIKRIPNIKKLDITYDETESNGDYYCLNNLECLHKLESFRCFCLFQDFHDRTKMLTFPRSLRKLRLHFSDDFELEEILEKIGSLPLLQKLELRGGLFGKHEWVTVEGQFPRLVFLTLEWCRRLEQWMFDSSHFPLLQQIYLNSIEELKEIPSEIGDIPTLRAIQLRYCNMSAVMSLRKVLEELHGEEQLPFGVRVIPREENREALKRLEGPNFKVAFPSSGFDSCFRVASHICFLN